MKLWKTGMAIIWSFFRPTRFSDRYMKALWSILRRSRLSASFRKTIWTEWAAASPKKESCCAPASCTPEDFGPDSHKTVVFDPHVYLRRFFAEGNKGEYLFLIDEAHNLVERGREMYSAVLRKEDFLKLKKVYVYFMKKAENGKEKTRSENLKIVFIINIFGTDHSFRIHIKHNGL